MQTVADRGAALLADSTCRRLMVFSHPNHELAVFGMVQRLRPYLLYLSDGGGAQRVAETRRGLHRLGLLAQTRFLDHPEARFYDAVLRHDVAFCDAVAGAIRREIDQLGVDQVICDAVEFYNPVHDLSLPLVLRAGAGSADLSIFEVPLVFQRPAPTEEYEIQRFPSSAVGEQTAIHLTGAELDAKLTCRDEIYHELRNQMPAIAAVPADDARMEVTRLSRGGVPLPDGERVLRYEWRGRLHRERGLVADVITYAEHYRPLLGALGVG